MKHTTSKRLTCLMVTLFLSCSAFVQAENLLRNESFERLQNNAPRGWTTQTWGGQADFTVDDAGRTGKAV